MRFFHWRAWRATADLDQLPVGRAKLLVRTAKRERRWRAARWTLVTVTAVVSFMIGIGCAPAIAYALRVPIDQVLDHPGVIGWGYFALMILSPWIGGFLMHRWLVLRAVRKSLAKRAFCLGCGVGLAGRTVDVGGRVWCAGCDRTYEPETAWGEVEDRNGVAVFRPRVLERRERLWEWWFFPPAACVLALAAPVVVAVVVFEVTAALDAKQARRDRTGYAAVLSMADELQPPGSVPTGPRALDRLDAAFKAKEQVDGQFWSGPEGQAAHPEFTMPPEFRDFGRPYSGQLGYSDEAQFLSATKLAAALIGPYRNGGVFEQLDGVADQPRWEMRWEGDPRMPMMGVPLTHLKTAREMAKVNRVRAVLAAEAGDVKEFGAAVASIHGLAEVCGETPAAIAALVSIALRDQSQHEVRKVLNQRPTADWVDACERALHKRRPTPDIGWYLRAERSASLDYLAFVFTMRSAIRSRAIEAVVGDPQGVKVHAGFYDENRRAIEVAFDELIAATAHPRHQRPQAPLQSHGLFFATAALKPLEIFVYTLDQSELDDRGTLLMIELEKYRIAHGEYPESLERLSLPADRLIDPWSGKSLGYRRFTADEARADPQGWGYRLWSVGADGFDNGGKLVETVDDRYRVLRDRRVTGYDFVINDLDR